MTVYRDVIACAKCERILGPDYQDQVDGLRLLLAAHHLESPSCAGAGFETRQEPIGPRELGKLTYETVEEIICEAYDIGHAHGGAPWRIANGEPPLRTND